MPRMGRRLEWIDGLRGLAVLFVVVFHAWNFGGFAPFLDQNAGKPTILLASLGTWGVSLFLVLSGFCLSYTPLCKHASGQAEWFSVRKFALSRCRRILPPYYAALLLFSGLALYFKHQGMELPIMRSPTLPDALSHIVLVHNNFSQFAETIDSPLWSLGLEWQWYWVFPLLLLSCLRWPRLTLLTCVLVAVAWAGTTHLVHGLSQDHTLPGRLTEFCCGIVAARIVVSGKGMPLRSLALIGTVCLLVTVLFPLSFVGAGLYYPMCGAGFAAFLLFAWQHPAAHDALRWRPLVLLGELSYSLYLVHWPIIGAVEAGLRFGLHTPVAPTIAAGITAALLFGWSFHILFERPFMRYDQLQRRFSAPRPPIRRLLIG